MIVPSLSNQFPEFAAQAQAYWKSLGDRMQELVKYSRRLPPPVVEGLNHAIPQVRDTVIHTVQVFFAASLAYVIYLPWLILIPILAFFLLKDAEEFRRSALLMLPRGRWRWRGDEFFQDINSTLAAYIRAQLTACVFIGVICALGFTLLGLPGGLVMGFIAGVLEFVPLVGPLTVAVMAANTRDVSCRAVQCFSRTPVPRSFAYRAGLRDLSKTNRPGHSSSSTRRDIRDSCR